MKKRIISLWIIWALAIFHLPIQASPYPNHPSMPPPSTLQPALCEKVVDGDTAWFQVEEEGVLVTHKVRFLLMDTPETVHPNKGVEEGGMLASDFVSTFLTKQEVYLEYDKQQTDRYGRKLCHIWLPEGILFNLFLVDMGLAKVMVYKPNILYLDYFTASEENAKALGLGIWASVDQ